MTEKNKKNDEDLKEERKKLKDLGVNSTWDLLTSKKKEKGK